jgi:predicted membrane protein
MNGFSILLILIGIFFLLVNWNVLGSNFWKVFWPTLIVGIGLWIILKPKGFKGKIPQIKDDDLGAFIIFSGVKRQIESKQFKGGKATALFGGIELDFYKANLSENQATIEITALFGGIEIFVPKEWKIVLDSSAVFGAVEDKRREKTPEDTSTTLYVKATALFGGIEIKN